MEKDTHQNRPGTHKVRKLFDQTLGQHIERLIGTRYGIGALPINLATISCLIFLTERETEIESFHFTPSERYTHEILLDELAEIGLDLNEELNIVVQDMIQKGYIDVDNDGRFSARNSTISMVQLLDDAFPKMPGMNLIAYYIQTMDEAQSGRKDLDSALSQFDQILWMQGVPLAKQKTQPKPEKAPRPSVTPHISRSEPKILSANGNLGWGEVEIRELSAWQDKSPETSLEMDEAIEAQKPDIPQEAKEEEPDRKAEAESPYAEPEVSPESLSGISSEPGSEMEDLSGEMVHADTSLEETPPVEQETGTKSIQPEEVFQQVETKIVSELHALERADDIIEKRIVTQCPICRNGDVKAKETATGRHYYKCSNKNCNLISWGKPYDIVCQQCKNPFLVEASDRDGKRILKCPRATCRSWQRLPSEITDEPQESVVSQDQERVKSNVASRKPRRRVLRRRVVRRLRRAG